ncbi:MAG TPA: AAA family ATPase [Microbacteriaceae bacterium]
MVSALVDSPLVGRDRDLQSARQTLADAATDSMRTLLVAGEAGIGKTRLVAEFLGQLPPDTVVVRGQCVDFDRDAPPYAPLITMLRQHLRAAGTDAFLEAAGPTRSALRALLPELDAESPGDLPTEDPTGDGRGRLYAAIAAVLESAARTNPLVLVVEDLHWADRATLGVLRFLLKAVDIRGLLIVLTFRTDELAPGHALRLWLPELERSPRVVRIDLARLTRAQVKRMALAVWDEPVTRAEIDTVYERSDGVPFFVEELVCAGQNNAGQSNAGQNNAGQKNTGQNSGDQNGGDQHTADRAAFPGTLRGILLARYDALDDTTQRLLRVIAAGGQRVEHELFLRVTSDDEFDIDTAARKAVSADILVVDDTAYAFRHALMREAIHTQLLPGERVRVHTRYAQALSESQPSASVDAGQIAYHWMAAHNLRNAFTASLSAMEQARSSFATERAARLGERAIELWDSVSDAAELAGRSRVTLLSETAYILRNAGESERALALIDEALADTSLIDAAQHATMLRNKASFLANLGRSGSIELLREALMLLDSESPTVLRANVLGELAARLMLAARFEEAIETADHAYAEAHAVGSPTRTSIAANIRGFSRLSSGHIEEGLDDLTLAGEVAATAMDTARLRFWVNQSDALNALGRFDDAVRVAEEGVAVARRRGVERTSGAILACNLIAPLYALGRYQRARELLDSALELDPPIGFSAPLQRLALQVTLWGGDPETADQLLHRWRAGLDRQRRIDAASDRQLAGIAAEIALERGDVALAWREVSAVLEPERRSFAAYDVPLLAITARTLAALRSDGIAPQNAGDELRRMLKRYAWWPTFPVYAALVDAELGGSEHAGDDPELWQNAVFAAQEPVAPAQLWPYATFRLARALLAHADRQGAHTQAKAARERAEAIGCGLIVQHIDILLERAGLTGAAVARVGVPKVTLTEREQQVLKLLSEGLSNREIAERLYISVKTASVHVSNILRKTGTTSRTQAAYLTRG